MKCKLTSFLAGLMTALVLSGLTLPALAAGGGRTILVTPIRVLVDGEVFRPKDATGRDVEVFCYEGTTYAPLRALAEAYGLTVDYDASRDMAVVTSPGKSPAATSSFASQWRVVRQPGDRTGDARVFNAFYDGPLDTAAFKAWWRSLDPAGIAAEAERMAVEAQALVPGCTVTLWFVYGTCNLGSASAMGGYQMSNFDIASSFVK